jgi:hypothetical protein
MKYATPGTSHEGADSLESLKPIRRITFFVEAAYHSKFTFLLEAPATEHPTIVGIRPLIKHPRTLSTSYI